MRSMSLRTRLSLWSTLILAVVFTVFSLLAFFSVQYFLYQSIDDNLERHMTGTIVDMMRNKRDLSDLRSGDEVGIVFYTVIRADGTILYSDRNVPISDDLFNRALSDGSAKDTLSVPDGSRVRVLVKRLSHMSTGEVLGVLQAVTPLTITDEILKELSVFLGLTSILLLVVAAAGSNILTGQALQAVARVTEKAHQIELSQDLSQRIPEPRTGDEIGDLARTFNQMLARLQAAFDAQRQFVADSSHELRTPITVIKSNLHVLRREPNSEDREELLSTTEAEVSRLNRMVNDLLYMAQMQAGHALKPIMRPVELDSLLLEVFARSRPIAALKEQKLLLVHEDVAATLGDRDQLQHALLNLVENAVKYTPPGGTVTLGLWQRDGWVQVEVSDTGPGIPTESMPHIFERFFRAPEARQSERNGSGLGLAIVRSIIEAHGGRVDVRSRIEQGTTFVIHLKSATAPTTIPNSARNTAAPLLPDNSEEEKVDAI